MTENTAATAALQTFAQGVMFEIQGKKFTVEKLGEPGKLRPHLLTGPRGASYWMHGYITAGADSTPERYYIVSVRGTGEPLRGKNGRRLEAYIFGDLISTAN